MPSYRIHRLKDHLRQYFRQAPHVSGAASVKPRDYNHGEAPGEAPREAIEARTPYAAYFELRAGSTPLEPGDLLESETGDLRIFKFVGFEEARWVIPEPKPEGKETSNDTIPIPVTVE